MTVQMAIRTAPKTYGAPAKKFSSHSSSLKSNKSYLVSMQSINMTYELLMELALCWIGLLKGMWE